MTPKIVNVDKNAVYPPALKELKEAEALPKETELRQVEYLNNLIEQDQQSLSGHSPQMIWIMGHWLAVYTV